MHRTNFAVVQNPEQRNMGCEETWRISNWAHALEGIITLEVPVRSCEISSAILKISSDRRTRFENDETVHTDVSAPLGVRSSAGRVRTKRNQLWFILLVRKGEYSGRIWWRHQMKKIRATGLLCGEFTSYRWIPTRRPATRSFDIFFDLCLNKQLCKQPRRLWFDTPSRS